RKSGIRFSRYPPRQDLQYIGPKLDQQMIAVVFDLFRARQSRVLPVAQHLLEQVRIILFLYRGQDQAWVRRCVLRLERLHRLKIGRVSHDLGKFLQLLQLIQLRPGFLFRLFNCGAHKYSILLFAKPYAAASRAQSKLWSLWIITPANCDTRGGGLVLAGNDWRSIFSGFTQWGRYR